MDLNLGEGFTPHFGKFIEQLPILIEAGEKPISVDIALAKQFAFPETWGVTYIFTGDVAITGVKGDVVIELDSPTLLSHVIKDSQGYHWQGKLNKGVSEESKELWEEAKSNKNNLYLTQSQVYEADGNGYVKKKGVWQPENKSVAEVLNTLARGRDLQEHAELAFQKSNSAERVLDLHFDKGLRQKPTMRAWFVDTLKIRSYVGGGSYLDYTGSRLVGVTLKALEQAQSDIYNSTKFSSILRKGLQQYVAPANLEEVVKYITALTTMKDQ
ncbi:MAG: hypothetical protein WC254_04725 [Candidatus Woesearchaeota archaeon]|jgi:hypothetical protein